MVPLIPTLSRLPATERPQETPTLEVEATRLTGLSNSADSRPCCRPSCWVSWLWPLKFSGVFPTRTVFIYTRIIHLAPLIVVRERSSVGLGLHLPSLSLSDLS